MTDFRGTQSATGGRSVAKAWMRALELTSPISGNPHRVFPTVIQELAARWNDAPALLSDRECLTYRALAERSNQYARWALDQGLAKADVVCLLMPNRPEYMAIWIGIGGTGGVVSLLNTNLAGLSLAHCINIAGPKHIIVAAELADALTAALPYVTAEATIWVHGASSSPFHSVDREVARQDGEPLTGTERRPLTIEDRALCIYTSGTTGLPKAVNVSHARVMQWCHWFAGMMDTQPSDRMYDCLPMYHSVGGVLAPGAALVGGGSVVIRKTFSASHFWDDVRRWDCTLFQYIGELCRYLLHAAPSPGDTCHRIRMACGNGLRPEVWDGFKRRFGIPGIFEFYAATEGGVSLFNIEGKRGAIGHIPSYLAHRFSPALVQFDVESGEPVRDENGFCRRCAQEETGEAIGQVLDAPSNAGGAFEGYTDKEASRKRILHDVFKPGDAWVRTGDLMRKDAQGFFYFVDRIGDTFRWKGENVAASEVSDAICAFPGVTRASVYGVEIPGTDGRAGMATIAAANGLDLQAFREHLTGRLPRYAHPLFLRIRSDVEMTGTFKTSTPELARQGYDPTGVTDAIFFNDPRRETFVRLDETLYRHIQAARIRT